MNSPWYNGTLNAKAIGNGNFVSTDIQIKRLNALQNNSDYRERIEKAQKIAGYEDKLLLASRGCQPNAIDKLMNQSKKAEQATKEKTNETIKQSNIITLS